VIVLLLCGLLPGWRSAGLLRRGIHEAVVDGEDGVDRFASAGQHCSGEQDVRECEPSVV
jgi:hypothetical protein